MPTFTHVHKKTHLGVVHIERPQRIPVFLHTHTHCPDVTPPPPPSCGRLHLVIYTALWSGSVVADALKIQHSLISRNVAQTKKNLNIEFFL